MIIIGEKLNATIPRIREAIISRDGEMLKQLAIKQEKAGAGYIDLNIGTGEGTAADEITAMEWLVALVKDDLNAKLCIDSADPKVLEAGLKLGGNKVGMVNSVKATDENIEEILPMSAEYGVPVIALAMDEKGIPDNVAGRLKACEKIIKGADKYGLPQDKIFFDPLVMPVSTDNTQGKVTLETLREIKNHYPDARTVIALSNISFGLPKRSIINSTLLQMAMYLSVDAALIDPLDSGLMASIRAAEAVLGRDRHCRKYTRAFRQGNL